MINSAYENFRNVLRDYSSHPFMLQFCFDKAHALCHFSAVDGSFLRELTESTAMSSLQGTNYPSTKGALFSHFQVLQQGLNYLSVTNTVFVAEPRTLSSNIPRIFMLFIDTTSILNNFQPQAAEDPSSRFNSLRKD